MCGIFVCVIAIFNNNTDNNNLEDNVPMIKICNYLTDIAQNFCKLSVGDHLNAIYITDKYRVGL